MKAGGKCPEATGPENFVRCDARGCKLKDVMPLARRTVHARTVSRVRLAAVLLVTLLWAVWLRAAVVSVTDKAAGIDYMSGDPITLPAAKLCTNLFRNGAPIIRNRSHVARPAVFDSTGRLSHRPTDPVSAPSNASRSRGTNGFPAYLEGQQYVWFLQDVRHYTNYSCTVTVDCPSTFYLLVDNRVNDFARGSEYDDPTFGPPDTQWVPDDGWQRVNTGLTPLLTPTCAGDYVGIDEGNNYTINQVYAVYARRLNKPGSITLGTEFDGNIYCLIVSTNPPPPRVLSKAPGRVSAPNLPPGK